MRSRLPRCLAPLSGLVLVSVAGCGLPGIGPSAPAATDAAPSSAASTATGPAPAKPPSADPSTTAEADTVVVTGKDDTFRLVLPPKWKVVPRKGGLDKVTVSPGGVLKPNAARAARNDGSYELGIYVIAVKPARGGGEPNVNVQSRDAGGVSDVGDLAGPSKQALEGVGATDISSDTTTVGGDPALQIRSRLQQGEFNLAITQFLVIADDNAWITTVTELDDERSDAPQIADGLDFSL